MIYLFFAHYDAQTVNVSHPTDAISEVRLSCSVKIPVRQKMEEERSDEFLTENTSQEAALRMD